jgi:hypothetical protein
MTTPLIEALNPRIAAGSNSLFILPELRILSFDQRDIDIPTLCNMVINWAAVGQPLSSLQLPWDGYGLGGLEQHVEVERYHAEALDDDDSSWVCRCPEH